MSNSQQPTSKMHNVIVLSIPTCFNSCGIINIRDQVSSNIAYKLFTT